MTASCQASRFNPTADYENGGGGGRGGLSSALLLRDLTIEVAGRPLLEGASVSLQPDRRYGLIGPNGTGKSTLLRQLAVPGKLVPAGVRALLVRQEDAVSNVCVTSGQNADDLTPLEVVVSADESLAVVVRCIAVLEEAVATADPSTCRRVVKSVRSERLQSEADQLAAALDRSSGARAKELRARWFAASTVAAEAAAEGESSPVTAGQEDAVAAAMDLLAELQDGELDSTGETVVEALDRARDLLLGLGFPEPETTATRVLSGGWRMRLALAKALFAEPALLMLDEPSNHLDLSSTRWLQQWLAESLPPGTCLIVASHDVDFLDGFATDILRVAPDELKLEAHVGMDYSGYAEASAARSASLARESAATNRKKAAMEKSVEGMLANVAKKKPNYRTHDVGGLCCNRYGDRNPYTDPRHQVVKARRKKLEERWGAEHNDRGARFKLSRDMAGFHESARLEVTGPSVSPEVRLELEGAPPLGSHGPVLQLEEASFGWEGTEILLQGVTLDINTSTRLGIVGNNGSGKSTLLAALSGLLQPRDGIASRHPNLRVAHYSQHHAQELLQPTAEERTHISSARPSAVDLMAARYSLKALDARSHLAKFGLKGRLAVQPMEELSGGQKARAALALLFWRPPHILLLDEPTNHMDMNLVDALMEALKDLNCGVVVAGHHRSFLAEVCEELQEVKDGKLTRIPGDKMEDYLYGDC